MQSYLQYRRISRDVESRFSKTIADSTSKSTETPLRERSIRSPFEANRHTYVTDTHPNGIPSTQEANQDVESALSEYGVNLRKRTTREGKGPEVLEVGWAGEHDPANPKNWSKVKRISATLLVSFVTFACLLPSSIDAAIVPQAAKTFGVSDVVESMVIGK
jgi:hypothetical protein